MPVYRQPRALHFAPGTEVEKHFHDHDETWLVTRGSCRAYQVDRDGRREEFDLHAGDVWMIEAGVEHGCIPAAQGGVDIFPFPGTIPAGAHRPGHYSMEQERYLPTLRVEKTPLARYPEPAGHA